MAVGTNKLWITSFGAILACGSAVIFCYNAKLLIAILHTGMEPGAPYFIVVPRWLVPTETVVSVIVVLSAVHVRRIAGPGSNRLATLAASVAVTLISVAALCLAIAAWVLRSNVYAP